MSNTSPLGRQGEKATASTGSPTHNLWDDRESCWPLRYRGSLGVDDTMVAAYPLLDVAMNRSFCWRFVIMLEVYVQYISIAY